MDHAARLAKTAQTVTRRLGSGNEVTIERIVLGDPDPATGIAPKTEQSLGTRVKAVTEGPTDEPVGNTPNGTLQRRRVYRVARADLTQEPRPGDQLIHHGGGGDGEDLTLRIERAKVIDHNAMCEVECVDNAKK